MKEGIEEIFHRIEKISQSDKKSITIEEFVEEAFFIASEKLKIV